MGVKQYFLSLARRSIRAYLYLLISAVVLPLVALAAFDLYRAFAEARQAAEQVALRLAQVSSAQAAQVVGEVRTDLLTLSRRPLVRALESGFELIRRLRARAAPPRVVAVTLHESTEYRAAVRRSGAEGCISKQKFGAAIPELIASLCCTANA